MVASFISSAIMQSGMFKHDSIVLTEIHMPGISLSFFGFVVVSG